MIAAVPFVQNRLRDVPWFKDLTPNFRVEEHEDSGFLRASYTSFCINVPLYTQWLVRELRDPRSSIVPSSPFLDDTEADGPLPSSSNHSLPVAFQRIAEATSLAEVAAQFPDADMIVNATGLGAAKLSDVKDETVYPIAGQVVVVSSPRFKQCPRCVMGLLEGSSSPSSPVSATAGQPLPPLPDASSPSPSVSSARRPTRDEKAFRAPPVTYIIPRAKSGQVVIGGSYDEGSFDTSVSETLSEDILKNAVQICPDLLLPPPEEIRNFDGSACRSKEERTAVEREEKRKILEDKDNAWKRLKVISAHVGLRPARKNGIRIERQSLSSAVAVVHAYGIGPAGYQASWGVAHQVALEVRESLRELKPPRGKDGRRNSKGCQMFGVHAPSDMERHVGWPSVGYSIRAEVG